MVIKGYLLSTINFGFNHKYTWLCHASSPYHICTAKRTNKKLAIKSKQTSLIFIRETQIEIKCSL